jgi:hypothetical protein
MRRDLEIALRARLTWAIAAASALLVGHGFILAVDVYSASSRSALASTLEGREMDPLAGIVRPMLGGLDLAISIFAPLVAARGLSIEKERRTFGALCLLQGGSDSVVASKLASALTAAWTQTVAQAAALAVAISLTSWAIDAASGFAALAWLGGASAWSIDRKLDAFERGVVEPGAIAWLVIASAGAAVIALLGVRFDLSPSKKAGLAAGMAIAVAAALVAVASSRVRLERATEGFAAAGGGRPAARPSATALDRRGARSRRLEARSARDGLPRKALSRQARSGGAHAARRAHGGRRGLAGPRLRTDHRPCGGVFAAHPLHEPPRADDARIRNRRHPPTRLEGASLPGLPGGGRRARSHRPGLVCLCHRPLRTPRRRAVARPKKGQPMKQRPFVIAAVLAAPIAAGPGCDRPTQGPSSSASASTSSSPAMPPAIDPGAAPESGARSDRGGSVTGITAANTVTFDDETVGDPSTSFEEVVGDWYVADRAGGRGLVVDGSTWRSGTPSANLADQAKHLYGDRYAQFLDGVKAFAFFPLAIWNGEMPAGDARISVRFYPFAGKVDQAAGIAFAIAPDGSYLGIRANALEDNLLYFKVVKGRRTVFDDVRGPTARGRRSKPDARPLTIAHHEDDQIFDLRHHRLGQRSPDLSDPFELVDRADLTRLRRGVLRQLAIACVDADLVARRVTLTLVRGDRDDDERGQASV